MSSPREARGDFVPPSGTPLFSGTLGGPAVHPFGSGGYVGAHREDGLTRSGEAHSYSPHLSPFRLPPSARPVSRLTPPADRVPGRGGRGKGGLRPAFRNPLFSG